ncbi:phospholipid:diacylglycerol acyltransferase [Binucleata daphniae]
MSDQNVNVVSSTQKITVFLKKIPKFFSQITIYKKIALLAITTSFILFYFPFKVPKSVKNVYINDVFGYINELHQKYLAYEVLPAEKLKSTLKPKHPVIIIPGITSSILEIWQGKNHEFRTNIWGKSDMIIQMLTNINKWVENIVLNKDGLDPEGIKIRAANGLSSSDYIFPMYWVWQKILNNFGILGYDHLNLHVSTYDWRLSLENLEKRDKYFSRLKLEIEMFYKLNSNTKVVLLTHSLGSLTALHFLQWVSETDPEFVDKHIQSFINIAAPFLGVTKSISGLLSGESRSTTSFFEGMIFDFMINTDLRKKVFKTWDSIKTLLPKGGKYVWGSSFVVDIDGVQYDIEEIIKIVICKNVNVYRNNAQQRSKNSAQMRHKECINDNKHTKNHRSINKTKIENKNVVYTFFRLLKTYFRIYTDSLHKNLRVFVENLKKYKFIEITTVKTNKIERNEEEIVQKNIKCLDNLKLPFIKNLKIYTFYGTGIETERGYYYTLKKNKLRINRKVNNKNTKNGIILCNGDGTVPAFSCGYLGYRGWKGRYLNPGQTKTVVKEYEHERSFVDGIRGGPKTSDHVDILGNHKLAEDILKICCGKDEDIKDHIISDLEKECDEIDEQIIKG